MCKESVNLVLSGQTCPVESKKLDITGIWHFFGVHILCIWLVLYWAWTYEVHGSCFSPHHRPERIPVASHLTLSACLCVTSYCRCSKVDVLKIRPCNPHTRTGVFSDWLEETFSLLNWPCVKWWCPITIYHLYILLLYNVYRNEST